MSWGALVVCSYRNELNTIKLLTSMNLDIEFIKANILNYEISRTILGWTVQEMGGEISMIINRDVAFELLTLIDKKQFEQDSSPLVMSEEENARY